MKQTNEEKIAKLLICILAKAVNVWHFPHIRKGNLKQQTCGFHRRITNVPYREQMSKENTLRKMEKKITFA